ncbi:MAG: S9 family peptidase [Rhodothermales bacterium]|nr:S9 family peptidase [Rhodothermales bacterium]
MPRLHRLPLLSALTIALTIVTTAPSLAQEKKPLTHDDYERWSSISDEALSKDGDWAVWREAPDTIGDGRVVVRSTDGRRMYVIERGDSPAFGADGGFLVAMVHPPYDSTRQAKLDGKSGDDLPQDSLVVLDLSSGARTAWADVDSYRLPEDGGAWVAVKLNEMPSDTTETARDGEAEPDSSASGGPDHDKTDGAPLFLYRVYSGVKWTFDHARDYRATDDGAWLVYTAESEDGTADGAFAVNAATGEVTTLLSGPGHYRHPAVDDMGSQVAFLSNTADFDAEQPSFSLYRADLGGGPADAVVSEGHDALPNGWWVSEHESPRFSESGDRLFFGTAPRPAPEPDQQIPDDEKVPVDVWSWDDDYLMTVQLENRKEELERSYLAVVHLADERVAQLADETMPDVDVLSGGDADTFIGRSNIPYRQDREWDYPWASDVYAVDVSTGERRMILEQANGSILPSPDGSSLAWWDRDGRSWRLTAWNDDFSRITSIDISSDLAVPVHNGEHDWPYGPNPYGSAGWTEDGSMFVFYDEFDMWGWQSAGDAGAGELVAITAPRRDDRSVRYRWIRTDNEAHGIPVDAPQLLSLFNEQTKASGFAEWRLARGPSDVLEIVLEDLSFGFEGKADDDSRVLVTRETYEVFPDLWTAASWREIPNATRLSDVNPHQDEYAWGTVELVHWTSTDGERLDGLLYKPEGFDPSEQYPMMTYFYERSSDGLHGYHSPAPGRSVINRTFYASRGYLVFVPDIPYKIGYPGESAMNAVMPGVTHLIDQGFVDRERVGVQGHSWGGYQIAYMVTRTNLFAAAEAGAPVSNMISAYGGIRWETGLSRQFQYERTQSRIGGSIWEKPLRYIENSPIFWLDKVETPLLIMHNDADGHVPWYQGIELFVGLRRLDKPAWFINYNDEPHWPLPYFKRLDWTMRLQQFFDHYLMDAPAPVWLEHGVPAVDKGRTRGLELVEPPADGR